MNWQEFFAMGGYAFYVWTSYGVTVLVLFAIAVLPVLQRKLFLKELAHKMKRMNKL